MGFLKEYDTQTSVGEIGRGTIEDQTNTRVLKLKKSYSILTTVYVINWILQTEELESYDVNSKCVVRPTS